MPSSKINSNIYEDFTLPIDIDIVWEPGEVAGSVVIHAVYMLWANKTFIPNEDDRTKGSFVNTVDRLNITNMVDISEIEDIVRENYLYGY